MEKTITKTITICDSCSNEQTNHIYYVCSVCDRRVCSNCLAVGGIFSKHYYNTHPDVCRFCYEKKEIKAIIDKYASKYTKMEQREAVELSNTQKEDTNGN